MQFRKLNFELSDFMAHKHADIHDSEVKETLLPVLL